MSLSPDAGFWLSITDLAARSGLTKQTVSEKVARLAKQGRITPQRGGAGQPTMVNVAEYETALGATQDAIRALAATPASPASAAAPDGTLAAEQTRKIGLEADLAQIKLDTLKGALIATAAVASAMTQCAETLVRRIDQLPTRADELAAAVARDGAAGARAALKLIAGELREQLARDMRLPNDTLDQDPS